MTPSHGFSSSSKTPNTAVAGCSFRCLPMFWFWSPERLSSAGVWIAPHGHDHRARADRQRGGPPRSGPTIPRAAPPSTSTRSTFVRDDQPRAPLVRVGEPGLDDRLLGAHPAARARSSRTPCPARSGARRAASRRRASPARRSPSWSFCSRVDGLVVLLVDAQPLAHGVEAGGVVLGGERGDAVRGPLRAHLVGGPERGRVVDDRAAAEARPRRSGPRSGRAWPSGAPM